jgi:hypothetical protein
LLYFIGLFYLLIYLDVVYRKFYDIDSEIWLEKTFEYIHPPILRNKNEFQTTTTGKKENYQIHAEKSKRTMDEEITHQGNYEKILFSQYTSMRIAFNFINILND